MMNEKQKENVKKRLNKIEGQIRGIGKMLDDDRYCIDILNQTSAVASALKKVENLIMEQHLHSCVVNSFKSGDEKDRKTKIDEIMDMLSRFRKNA